MNMLSEPKYYPPPNKTEMKLKKMLDERIEEFASIHER